MRQALKSSTCVNPALPSPPLSDTQSRRGASPFHTQSRSASPSSNHSGNMDVDHSIHFDETKLPLLDPHPESGNTGFLAQTGRRTTVHFPHTLPSSKVELLAPTPIRRSHSQELLNADYTNFKLGQSQAHLDGQSSVQTRTRSTTTSSPRLSPAPKQSSRHQDQNQNHSLLNMTRNSSLPVLRSNSSSQILSPTRILGKPSDLRKSWDSNMPSTDDRCNIPQDLQHRQHHAQSLRPIGMQRSSSHSSLSLGKPHLQSPHNGASYMSPAGYDPLERFIGNTMALQLGMPFNMPIDAFGPRRASLPDAFNPSQPTHTRPTATSSREFAPARSSPVQKNSRGRTNAPAPVIDVEMENDSSASEESDLKWKERMNRLQTTPKRPFAEKTLRRLKSSPSGESCSSPCPSR